MTAQMNDPIYFENKEWDLIASTSDFMIDPNNYGLKPVPVSTACWNGYLGEYYISNNQLYIKKLWLSLGWPGYPGKYDETKEGPEYPPLLGVSVKKIDDYIDFDHYYELNKPIEFSGKILLGCDFLSQYYIHMGFQQAWAYKTVKELEFEKGRLIKVNDYSERVEELRKNVKDKDDVVNMYGGLESFVGGSFSRNYEDKAWWINKPNKDGEK